MGQNFLIFLAATTFVGIVTCQESSQSQPASEWNPMLQITRDEFNTTEQTPREIFNSTTPAKDYPLVALKLILLRDSYNKCCISWYNLTKQSELQDDLRRKFGRARQILKASELLQEIKTTFMNITYLSIDGQPGEIEREKYYSFHDGVQYYLRLMKVARSYLNESISPSKSQIDFDRYFKRQLNSIEFRVSQDPTMRSFIAELLQDNPRGDNFELYENFISFTEFGQYYARNISMIRESALVFDQIYSHLTSIDFPSNFTRPSRQYKIIRGMSYQLYLIRSEIVKQISVRVSENREDARGIFRKLDELSETRPYIRMLGDEFSLVPANFGADVRQLTHLLDRYLFNNLTHLSFYNQLADLPQEFIILGSNIARFYENKEITHFNRFDLEYYDESNSQTKSYNTTSSGRTQNNATVARRMIGRMMSSIFNF